MDVDNDVEAKEPADWDLCAETDSIEYADIALTAYKEGELIEQRSALAALIHQNGVSHGEKGCNSLKRYDHTNCLEVVKGGLQPF